MLAPEPCAIGIGNLAAGEEARFLAALGDQVRLGEALEQAAGLQRLDDRAEVVLRVEEEQVQEVAERELALALVTCAEVAAAFVDSAAKSAPNCCVSTRPTVFLTPVGR